MDQQVAPWKIALARGVARLFPEKRIPLDLFTGSQSVQVSQGASDHTAQSSTNTCSHHGVEAACIDSEDDRERL